MGWLLGSSQGSSEEEEEGSELLEEGSSVGSGWGVSTGSGGEVGSVTWLSEEVSPPVLSPGVSV